MISSKPELFKTDITFCSTTLKLVGTMAFGSQQSEGSERAEITPL